MSPQLMDRMELVWGLIVGGVSPSAVDLGSAYALLCAAKIEFTDAQWSALATGYASKAFWKAAAARPPECSKPLATWREELQRVVTFDVACAKTMGSKMTLAEYAALWAVKDQRRSETKSLPPSTSHSGRLSIAVAAPLHASADLNPPERSCWPDAGTRKMAAAAVSEEVVVPVEGSDAQETIGTAEEGSSNGRNVRPRLMYPSSNQHAMWRAVEAATRDNLQRLYPHARDNDCWMDEIQHKYYVHNQAYPCSVSGVWKVFFPDFDKRNADRCMQSAETKGLKNIASTAFNLVQFLWINQQLDPSGHPFWARTQEAIAEAVLYYENAGWERHWAPDELTEAVQTVTAQPGMGKKPAGKDKCYFLVMCAGCNVDQLRQTWQMSGDLESFKGTFLHKQAELFMQELGAWQLERQVHHVPLRSLLQNPEVLGRARAACSPECTMASLVAHVSAQNWDHPATQTFFADSRRARQSPEYLRFEAWLQANLSLSPYRSEWSIYNEDRLVAGQVDSLWFDTDRSNAVVMADWKRAKEVLTSEESEQRNQSYGKTGLKTCAGAPGVPGPCGDLLDCSYNHYSAQQHLYAHFLEHKYGVRVTKMSLVQCHPDVGATDADYNEAVIEMRPGFAAALLDAFDAGWKTLL